jgi:hypothetical protein
MALLIVALVSTTAAADIRYRIWPSYGEMKSFGRPWRPGDCDAETRMQFWRALAHHPVVTVHPDGRIDLSFNFDAGEKLSDQISASKHIQLKGRVVGYWASKMPGLTFGIGITERRDYPPIIEVALALEGNSSRPSCQETWTGGGDKF